MTKKQILRVTAFCLLAFIMMLGLCEVFDLEDNKNYVTRIETYADYEENTVDGVFIGTSGIDRYWIASKAYDDYGMTVYPLSVDSLPSWLYPTLMEYAAEHQKPQLLLIDVRAFCETNAPRTMDIRSRRLLAGLPSYSPIWWKAVFTTMDTIHQADPERDWFDISLVLSFVRFHEKWEDAEPDFFKEHLGDFSHKYNGFFVAPSWSATVVPQTPSQHTEAVAPIDPVSEASFYKVLATAEKLGIPLLFVDTPQFQDETEGPRANYVYGLIEKEGYDLVHWYTDDPSGAFTIDLDPQQHFYNSGHVNFKGAHIFTDSLAAYLDEHYDFPDRRLDPAAQKNWDGVYPKMAEVISKYKDHGQEKLETDE